MSLSPQFVHLRAHAIELRRAGKSRREIKALLGIASNQTLGDALRGEPPPGWTRRPNAKDGVRARARELRAQGLDYEEIAARLGVSKSSVSLWVRDLPVPARLSYEECRKRSAEGTRRYWEAERPAREAERAAATKAAAAEIGPLTEREILIAGATAYWCEGTKSKPSRRNDRVAFINSDPALILLFLRFLATVGISPDRLVFRVYIHENADANAAQRFWLRTTGARREQFRPTTLKHHNPKTVRKNAGAGYYGCLRIDVLRGGDLYRWIEGWTAAITAVAPRPTGPPGDVSAAPGEGFEPSLTESKSAVLPG
jgi:transcriptional regulator with XRE-family HTH domain